ncbi:MAG: glycosyltransferase [bacterium]|nr:glycosyltransferase [bacterium]
MTHPYPFVNIIVTSYNRVSFLRLMLEALLRTVQYKHGFQINVVDNGSIDGSVEYLKSLPRDYHVKAHCVGRNLGVSGGINLGLELSLHRPGTFFLCLDNDMVALQKGWLTPLVEAAGAQSFIHLISYPMFAAADYARLDFRDFNRFQLAEVEPLRLWGCLIGIPYRTFRKIGYFDLEHCRDPYLSRFTDEHIKFGIEDTLYAHRVKLCGGKLLYMKQCGVFQHIQRNDPAPGDTYESFKQSQLARIRTQGVYEKLCRAYDSGRKPLRIFASSKNSVGKKVTWF